MGVCANFGKMTKKIFSGLVIREKCYEISDIFFDM